MQWPGFIEWNEGLVPGGVKLGTAVLRTVSGGLAVVMGAGMEACLHLSVDPDRGSCTVDWSFGPQIPERLRTKQVKACAGTAQW